MEGQAAHVLLLVASDEHVQLLVLAVVIFGVAAGALFDAALAADGDFCVGLLLHALLGVAARADDQPNEVVARIVLLGDEHLHTHKGLRGCNKM